MAAVSGRNPWAFDGPGESPLKMCGLAGFWAADAVGPVEEMEARLGAMIATLHHRGPDDRGVWSDGRVGLAHARLSIIDLSSHGHQPMSDPSGRVQVVFNGEIYNFQELRAELEGLNCHFDSQCDTEVIVHGYLQWGEGLFARLNGMFAIALWDATEQRLLLARDRVGKKPLYYGWHDNTLIFDSEIRAVLMWPGMPREANYEAIHHYLTYQYVPAPWTAFDGILKLPAAHYMVVEPNGRSRIERYWQLPTAEAEIERPAEQICEELRFELKEAVRSRLMSDVPLGALLSGGVDSSAVVAMMAELGVGTIKTFSIGFNEADYDETRYARQVAEQFGTEHHQQIVEPDALAILPQLVWHYCQPFADISAIPTFYVSQMAREQVTVVLNGDGGDENFMGYDRYQRMATTQYDRIPAPLRGMMGAMGRAMPVQTEQIRLLRGVRCILLAAGERDSRRYAPYLVYFGEGDKQLAYGDTMRAHLADSSLDLLDPYFAECDDPASGAARADFHTYLPDDLMVKVDIASMAYGLEARSPLLDHRFLEWAATIPTDQKLAGGVSKKIFKQALEPVLPHDILYRKKMGFGMPVEHWIRDDMRAFCYDTLLSEKAKKRGLFRPEYVQGILDEHCAGSRLHHTRIWGLLMLELWFCMWIDADELPTEAPAHP